ncbi:MAG: 30S ribosomal protein S13 [Proteobacteria bacterium]|nr:30S ribosomal protein S13 [Pseudomonadota bacterium]
MARLAGVELPREKRIDAALEYIYGIGPALARKILGISQVKAERRVRDLAEDEVHHLQSAISKFKVEGDLRREISGNIKRLIEIGSFRGSRHQKALPVRGQRTRTNARTRKGPRKTVGVQRAAKRARH